MVNRKPTEKQFIVERRQSRWHLDKRVTMDTLVGIAGIAIVIGGPLTLAWRSMEGRILKIETVIEEQSKAEAVRRADEREARQLSATQFKELSDSVMNLRIEITKVLAQTSTVAATVVRPAGAK